MGTPASATGGRGVRGDRRRERVGGVDDGGDVVLAQPVPQPGGAAETADPHRANRQRRIGNPPGQRADEVDPRMQPSARARASPVPPSSSSRISGGLRGSVRRSRGSYR